MTFLKKKILIILSMAAMAAGCGREAAVGREDFQERIESLGYTVYDEETGSYVVSSDSFGIEDTLVAVPRKGDYQVEYFEFDSEADCSWAYDDMAESFHDQMEDSSSMDMEKEQDDRACLKLVTEDEVYYLSRIGSTLVYISAPVEYRIEIERTIREIGY